MCVRSKTKHCSDRGNRFNHPVKMIFKTFIYAALTAAAFVQGHSQHEADVDKVDVACKPCGQPCPPRCPEPVAKTAAALLVNNFSQLVSGRNYAALQLISAKDSTARIIVQENETCVDSGVKSLLTIFSAYMLLAMPNTPQIEQNYVDAKGNLHVITSDVITVDSVDLNVHVSYLFEPVDHGCEYVLRKFELTQNECA